MKNILYYLVQWTWGIVMNIIGAVVFAALWVVDLVYCLTHPYHLFTFQRYRNAVCVILPGGTGAINLGMFIVCGKYVKELLPHEYGHSIQNMQWGPLFLFVIGLPSLFRSISRGLYYDFFYEKKRMVLPDYDSVWFEGQATEYGSRAKNNTWSWI